MLGLSRGVSPIGGVLVLSLFIATLPSVTQGSDYSQPGPWEVELREESLTVPGERRPLKIILALPVKADAGAAPLVVFSHGFLLEGSDYQSYGLHLASNGLAVALPTYRMTLLDADHGRLAVQLQLVVDHLAREADGGSLSGLVDASRLGLAGHSLGGKLSFMVATQSASPVAVAGIDPVDGGGPGGGDDDRFPAVVPGRMAELRVPILLIGAELGGEVRFGQACAPEDRNYQRFFEAASGNAIEITQLDAGHMQYLDDPGCGFACLVCVQGSAPSEEIRLSAHAYLTAFFVGHLEGRAEALTWLEHKLAEDGEAGRIVVRRKD
ncbi:MAG: hypothetical protein R6U88_03955 [Candidatus Bipolaricaulota bacterium]